MTITLTDSAAERVRHFIEQREGAVGLRLGIAKSGCSGYSYVMDLADTVGEDDVVIEDHGVSLVINRDSLPFIDGMEIDFTRDGLNQSFQFNNPNVTASCGCGESFAVG